MKKRKILTILIVAISITACLLSFCCCQDINNEQIKDAVTDNNVTQDSLTQTNSPKDDINTRVAFGKKYYYLGYSDYTENEYYTFYKDGSATYTHVMKSNDKITFHQEINFKWTYAGEGNCILMHNGTKMIKGAQDDAFGFSRVMHLSNDIVYWSTGGENTYFICEDFVDQIPNYAKLITNN